ncbi:1-deoxyxylulose-5-phosphate synthase YajO-like [Ylistrum balloti]|uniref:1-deoxyxylulose-5-phosphate synthase YajO-like n=1 Tax=Ylistrum balloti TaxID=509963 RepID=UPI0029057E52|nr:1-deoxyxylulose-5-phosphate synthase YajO-like [Ylistrum balloti]
MAGTTTGQPSPQVAYRFLGKSGLKVSNICLGTMTFGKNSAIELFNGPTQNDEAEAHLILDRFVEMGGNFIDTANIYSFGISEQIIGNWLQKQKRENLVIATKVRATMGQGPNETGLSRRHILQMCDDSLKRLQTDYIDLYQTHGWDSAVPIEETLRALDDLVKCGKVRYIGVCNVIGWQMQKIVDKAEALGINSIIGLQQQYSLLCRHPELEEFQVCRNEGIGVLPWSPLKGGLLTGKFQRGVKPDSEGSRIGFVAAKESGRTFQSSPGWSKYENNDFYWNLVDVMSKVAKNHGKSVPQVALRWLLQKNVVSSVIIGATSIKQLEDNMGASTGWTITKEEMEELDTASSEELPYPYEMVFRMNISRKNPFNGPSSFVENTQE